MEEKRAGVSIDRIAELVPDSIIKLGKSRYPTFKGLVGIMHRYGVESIETEILLDDPEKRRASARAVVTGTRGTYTAHGDSSPESSNSKISPHYLRHAETRAISRALRWYLGVGETVADELPDYREPVTEGKAPKPPTPRTIGGTGYTVEDVEGFLAWKKKPPFGKLSATDRRAFLDWLETDSGAAAFHDYYCREIEGP